MKVVLLQNTARCLVRIQETRDGDSKTIGLLLRVDVEATRSLGPGPSSASTSAAHQRKRNRDEEFQAEVKEKIMSDVLLGASHFIVFLRLSTTDEGVKTLVTTVRPPRSPLRTAITPWLTNMWDYPPAKLSVFFKIASDGDDENGELEDFASVEDMDVKQLFNRDGWSCRSSISTDMDSFPGNSKMHSKIVAEVPVNALLEDYEFPPTKKIAIAEEGDEAITVISRNGTELEASKSHLCDCSPVLEAMFRSEMQESVTGRLYMNDGMDEEGAKAFIQYTYCRDLTVAKNDMKIAFDMMCAGHKYEIRSLEVRAMEYLLGRRSEDFNVELAFEIYMFMRNVEFGMELKEKITEILKGKLDELMTLQEYQQIFEENPNSSVAAELEKEFGKPDSSE